MKTSIIIACIFIFFYSYSINAQWYTNKYGVESINNLTNLQLMESYSNAKNASWGGGVITVTGCVLIFSGLVKGLYTMMEATVYVVSFGTSEPPPETWGRGLLIAGAAISIPGSVLWAYGGSRKKQLRPIMKTRGLISNISIYPGAGYEKLTDSYFPSLTLRVEF